jgi:Fe-S-cluster containining protein
LVEQRIENPRVDGSIPSQATRHQNAQHPLGVLFCACEAAVRSSIHIVDVDRLETWTRYRAGLCDTCVANCCTMPLEVRLPDLVRLGVVDPFEAMHEAPKQVARRLEKAGLIEHFNFKREVFTIARRASGDCHFLDPRTRRCTVYEQRPDTCRQHPQVGPRPHHCPYGAKR